MPTRPTRGKYNTCRPDQQEVKTMYADPTNKRYIQCMPNWLPISKYNTNYNIKIFVQAAKNQPIDVCWRYRHWWKNSSTLSHAKIISSFKKCNEQMCSYNYTRIPMYENLCRISIEMYRWVRVLITYRRSICNK